MWFEVEEKKKKKKKDGKRKTSQVKLRGWDKKKEWGRGSPSNCWRSPLINRARLHFPHLSIHSTPT